jgi:hypothetical protein
VADSPAFELAATELERLTDLDRLEARGTLRLVLKKALFDARSVDIAQMTRVVERILPQELAARGVHSEGSTCERLATALKSSDLWSSAPQSPDAIFNRLIRR